MLHYRKLFTLRGLLIKNLEPQCNLVRYGCSRYFCLNRQICARHSSQAVIQSDPSADEPEKPKRLWPRKGSLEVEAISPPRSTSIAETSSAPLLIDLFRGQLHLELFDYPELPKKEDVDQLSLLHERVKNLVLQVNSTEIDQTNKLDTAILGSFAKHGLFGLQIGEQYGGRNLSYTQAARVWEALGLDGAVFAILDAHNNLAVQSIILGGSEEQKRHFLPSLATGEHMGAFCLSELSSGSDIGALKTRAVRSADGQTYTIHGCKNWVTNGASATQLITFARVEQLPNELDNNPNISAFVVERTQPGVQCSKVLSTFGLRGSNVTDISFENVEVPAANILGTAGSGLQLAQQVIDQQRLSIAASCTGLLRYIISYAAEHCLQRHQFGRPLGDYGLIQAKLSDLALSVYVMESGLFYLTGLLDAQPQRDLTLEKAALKLYASEALWNGVNECVQLTGRMGLSKDVPFERYLRDARSLLIQGGTSEMLRLLIAGSGFQSVGPERQEEMEKLRIFTRHPITLCKTSLRIRARRRGWLAHKVGAGPKVTEGGASRALKDHLHPNFSVIATRLAVLCQRFQSLVETSLITHRAAIVNEQMALARIADCAVDLFLVSVCLGRASRAISIGIHLHDYEVRLATAFAKLAFRRIESNLTDLADLDRDRHRIASEVLARRAYPVAHPLTRVW